MSCYHVLETPVNATSHVSWVSTIPAAKRVIEHWTDDLGLPVEFYRGAVDHILNAETVRGDGQAGLGWLLSPRVFVSWRFDHAAGQDVSSRVIQVEVWLPGIEARGVVRLGGSPVLPGLADSANRNSMILSGVVDGFVVDDDVAVGEVRFLVVNGPELFGAYLDDNNGGCRAARTEPVQVHRRPESPENLDQFSQGL